MHGVNGWSVFSSESYWVLLRDLQYWSMLSEIFPLFKTCYLPPLGVPLILRLRVGTFEMSTLHSLFIMTSLDIDLPVK